MFYITHIQITNFKERYFDIMLMRKRCKKKKKTQIYKVYDDAMIQY